MTKTIIFISVLIVLTSCRSEEIGIWNRFEFSLINSKEYANPFSDVRLSAEFIRPDGSILRAEGFYNGNNTWKIRIMPDQKGRWKYTTAFSDDSDNVKSGSFVCIDSDTPGLISSDEENPGSFGFKGGGHILIRSFHAGDRFFAENWPAEERKKFLDWLTENRYNTISVASHLLNRNADKRGKGWNTPDLWNTEKQQPNPGEYDKMEVILDDLAARKIIIFPFAGFFGQNANWPKDPVNQELYIRYTLSRLGAYRNILYNVAGPEPLFVKQFTEDEVNRFGALISSFNTQEHLLTVHNQKNQNPFANAAWATFQCLQGPTTLNTDTLYKGLMDRRNSNQPLLAQEVLWYGNIYQQDYSDDQLRKNAYTILMAGGAINFGDNSGTSSTGFTGTLDPSDCHQDKHEIMKKAWDFFETLPFYKFRPIRGLTNNGFCLSTGDGCYLIFLPEGGNVTIHLEGHFEGEWIKGSDTGIRSAFRTTDMNKLTAPSSDDWFLYIKRNEKN